MQIAKAVLEEAEVESFTHKHFFLNCPASDCVWNISGDTLSAKLVIYI